MYSQMQSFKLYWSFEHLTFLTQFLIPLHKNLPVYVLHVSSSVIKFSHIFSKIWDLWKSYSVQIWVSEMKSGCKGRS